MADELTWMDNAVPWPAPLLRDRSQARRPMSLGLRVHGDAVEAEFVLYAGGWADVAVIHPGIDEPIAEYVELDDVEEFGSVLDRSGFTRSTSFVGRVGPTPAYRHVRASRLARPGAWSGATLPGKSTRQARPTCRWLRVDPLGGFCRDAIECLRQSS
jgi:hypothetical protein